MNTNNHVQAAHGQASTAKQEAYKLAQAGMSVIPLTPGSKRPAGAWTTARATRMTPDDVLRVSDSAGFAVVCGQISGLVVLDIDVHHPDASGITSLRAAEAVFGPLPATPTARTPSGGKHYYFRLPPGGCKRKIGVLPGVDLLGEGSYAVLPGTTLPEGVYRWEPGRAFDEVQLAELPAWLLSEQQVQPLRTLFTAASQIQAAENGTRNNTLNKTAFTIGALVRDGKLPKSVCEEVLTEAARRAGLADKEIMATLQSGLNAGEESDYKPNAGKATSEEKLESLLAIVESETDTWLATNSIVYITTRTQPRQTYALDSTDGRAVLHGVIRQKTAKLLTKRAEEELVNILENHARVKRNPRPVYYRLAALESQVVIDLGDETWRAVVITKHGWTITDSPPVRFFRTSDTHALPAPVRGGNLDVLREFFNLEPDQWLLYKAYLVGVFCHTGGLPVLHFTGAPGSAKTTAARLTKLLLDPAAVDVYAKIGGARDIVAQAAENFVLAIDNVGHVEKELSDLFCGLATGTGFGARALYTNASLYNLKLKRPLILTSLGDAVTQPDLLDRTLTLELQPIESRLTESELLDKFISVLPAALGALYDAVSEALRTKDTIPLRNLIRMADFAQFAAAAAAALGATPAEVVASLAVNQNEHQADLITSTEVGKAVLLLMETTTDWAGTARQLEETLKQLPGFIPGKFWPRSLVAFGREINKLITPLKQVGIYVESWRTRTGMQYHISKTPTRPSGGNPTCPGGGSQPITGCDNLDAPLPQAEVLPQAAPAVQPPQTGQAESDTLDRLHALRDVPTLFIDTETTGLNPKTDSLRLVQLKTPGQDVVVVDLWQASSSVKEALAVVLQSQAVKVGHNLKFDLHFLAEAGLPVAPPYFCTMLASRVLYAGRQFQDNKPHSLAACCQRELGIEVNKEQRASDWSALVLTPDQLAYAAKDVEVLEPLFERLQALLHEEELTEVADLEMKLLAAVQSMEATGMHVDIDMLKGEETRARDQAARQETELKTLLPHLKNPNSPEQVKTALAHVGIHLESTSAAELARHVDKPAVAALLAYRKSAKLVSAFASKLPNHVNPATRRIHASFNQLGADTGRFTCSNPNLQQIPRDPEVRKCFRAGVGNKLVIADYSQIELRVAAVVANEQKMLDALAGGQDLHALTASLVLRKPLEDVIKVERQIAKSLNFGLLYGMGASGLVTYARTNYNIEFTLPEATKLREAWFTAYPAIRKWHTAASNAATGMPVYTLIGRRRLTDPRTSMTVRCNTTIQGTAADIMKQAIVLLHHALAEYDAKLVATVHDEVIVEVPEAHAPQVAQVVKDLMESAARDIITEVPIIADVHVGDSWAEK